MLGIPLKSRWNGIQKQNVPPAQRSADGEATGIIVIRKVPVFIRLLIAALKRSRGRADGEGPAAVGGPYWGGSGEDESDKFRSLDS